MWNGRSVAAGKAPSRFIGERHKFEGTELEVTPRSCGPRVLGKLAPLAPDGRGREQPARGERHPDSVPAARRCTYSRGGDTVDTKELIKRARTFAKPFRVTDGTDFRLK